MTRLAGELIMLGCEIIIGCAVVGILDFLPHGIGHCSSLVKVSGNLIQVVSV